MTGVRRAAASLLCLPSLIGAGLGAGFAPRVARAQEEPVRAATVAGPNTEAGLAWLARKQSLGGSWGGKNKLALTGMAGLALLSSGSTPQRGPYAEAIRRAILFVLRAQKTSEGRHKAYWDPSNGYSEIHNHGYALLFLTQAYGEGGPLDEELRRSIALGVQATIESQFTTPDGRGSDGGFGYFLYQPTLSQVPAAHSDMWRDDEASTTISQVQALRGARNAGFRVPRRALERAADYIARSRHATGGFHYSIGSNPPRVSFEEGSDQPTFAITAACTAVLHALGTYEGPVVEGGMAYIEQFLPPSKKIPFYYYAHYYAAQVMHMRPDARGRRWMDAIQAELAARQRADGRWPADPEDTLAQEDSELLNTAWALQVCLIERGMLPLHER
jgi:hypothetical protein